MNVREVLAEGVTAVVELAKGSTSIARDDELAGAQRGGSASCTLDDVCPTLTHGPTTHARPQERLARQPQRQRQRQCSAKVVSVADGTQLATATKDMNRTTASTANHGTTTATTTKPTI
jgi:hypothetical protein